MNNINKNTLYFCILLIVFFVLQFHELLFRMPSGIHEWAQGDRLALAYGFYDNGLNFWKPATLSQFSEQGITGVEFPIQAYLAAALAKIFGETHIVFLYRLLDITVIGFCLIILFRITFSFTSSFFTAILPSLVLLLSPCFLDYGCGFMPDPFSAAIVVVAIGLYLQCWLQEKSYKRVLALLLLIFSTLVKTSSGIYLIGFFAADIFFLLKKEIRPLSKVKLFTYCFLFLSGLCLVFGYMFYNRYLNALYDSAVFLQSARPADLRRLPYIIFERIPLTWSPEYFVVPACLLILGVLGYMFFSKKEIVYQHIFKPLNRILLIGIVIVFYLMSAQFIDHDYYAIAILFPFVVLNIFWFSISKAQELKFFNTEKWKPTILLIFLLGCSYFFLQKRLQPVYRKFSSSFHTPWMQRGGTILDSLNISQSEQIVALNENPPNLALVYFKRKGYALNPNGWGEKFESAYHFFASKNIFYGVIGTDEFNRLTNQDGTFYNYFDIVFQNEQLSIFKRK